MSTYTKENTSKNGKDPRNRWCRRPSEKTAGVKKRRLSAYQVLNPKKGQYDSFFPTNAQQRDGKEDACRHSTQYSRFGLWLSCIGIYSLSTVCSLLKGKQQYANGKANDDSEKGKLLLGQGEAKRCIYERKGSSKHCKEDEICRVSKSVRNNPNP